MDTVYLLIDGKKIDRFVSYEIDADLYQAGAGFSLELGRPGVTVKAGMECQLWVNDVLELTGIIDKAEPSYDKKARKLVVTGRDLMGWCVDAHVEDFITVSNYTVKDLAAFLLRKAPSEFFKLSSVQYAENVVGRLKSKASRVGIFDTTTPLSQIDPGMSVFDVLSEYAKSKGMLFFSMPDGTFAFGRPKDAGAAAFTITHRMSGRTNNVESGGKSEDISKRYSKVTVVGQRQGMDVFNPSQISVEAAVSDPAFPFFKPYVHKDEFGGNDPKLQARLLLEKMRHDGFRLNYTVKGHSQANKNWSINELAHVVDEDPDLKLDDDFLIYGRTFSKSKESGAITKLRLGYKGMMQ